MRVTDRVLSNTLITNLNSTSERLYQAEIEVLTEKRVNYASDDPVDALTALNVQSKLSEIEQYQRNINRATSMLETTESAVNDISDIFTRLNTLTVQGASDNYDSTDKQSIAAEVNQLLEELVSLSNSTTESVYIFAGTNNESAPYQVVRDESGEITSVTTTGTSGSITNLIGENITIKTNINGEDLFENGENLFQVLIDVRDHLRDDNTALLNEDLNHISDAADQVYNTQSMIGARLNRIYSAESRAENDEITYTELLSNAVDIDASEAIMNYQMELITLQATLQAGSMLFEYKLVDFLS